MISAIAALHAIGFIVPVNLRRSRDERGSNRMPLHRINCNDVTETLMRAVEHADKMKYVIVLHESKDDEDVPGGVFTQDDVTVAQMNWMVDQFKYWLIR